MMVRWSDDVSMEAPEPRDLRYHLERATKAGADIAEELTILADLMARPAGKRGPYDSRDRLVNDLRDMALRARGARVPVRVAHIAPSAVDRDAGWWEAELAGDGSLYLCRGGHEPGADCKRERWVRGDERAPTRVLRHAGVPTEVPPPSLSPEETAIDEALAEAAWREAAGSAFVRSDLRLPCEVRLPPSTTIGKGCKLDTLLHAIAVRAQAFAPFRGDTTFGRPDKAATGQPGDEALIPVEFWAEVDAARCELRINGTHERPSLARALAHLDRALDRTRPSFFDKRANGQADEGVIGQVGGQATGQLGRAAIGQPGALVNVTTGPAVPLTSRLTVYTEGEVGGLEEAVKILGDVRNHTITGQNTAVRGALAEIEIRVRAEIDNRVSVLAEYRRADEAAAAEAIGHDANRATGQVDKRAT